nr:putative sporulation protein YtxC [uncultured Bacillus sp.]
MIEIHFRHKVDAQLLHSFLQQQLPDTSIGEYSLYYEDSHIVRCRHKSSKKDELFRWTKMGLCHFIMKVKLNDWLKNILVAYYYRDEEEQQQIIEITHSIIEGKNAELNAFLPKLNLKEHLLMLIHEWLREQSIFSFDHFIKFRLRSVMNELEKYVELSLDEYKMEQEYQVFIQKLREFLSKRKPKLQNLHLLFDEGITFYNDHFAEMKRGELIGMIDRRLLINHPVYIDSVTIAPLLSIAPSNIHLYTNDLEQPLIRTIRNIFEERVICKPPAAFDEMRKRYYSLSMKKDKYS